MKIGRITFGPPAIERDDTIRTHVVQGMIIGTLPDGTVFGMGKADKKDVCEHCGAEIKKK